MDEQKEIQPWNKQPDKPHRSWVFFKIYRDLMFARTYRQVAEACRHSTLNCTAPA